MEELTKTNHTNKTGRDIHVGDIIQYGLGKFGKSGGPQNLIVIQFGKNTILYQNHGLVTNTVACYSQNNYAKT